jgi:hypothetical protein
MSRAASPSAAEIAVAGNALLYELSVRTDHQMRLTTAMRLAKRVGVSGLAMVVAVRRQGIEAARDGKGKWCWKLPAGHGEFWKA